MHGIWRRILGAGPLSPGCCRRGRARRRRLRLRRVPGLPGRRDRCGVGRTPPLAELPQSGRGLPIAGLPVRRPGWSPPLPQRCCPPLRVRRTHTLRATSPRPPIRTCVSRCKGRGVRRRVARVALCPPHRIRCIARVHRIRYIAPLTAAAWLSLGASCLPPPSLVPGPAACGAWRERHPCSLSLSLSLSRSLSRSLPSLTLCCASVSLISSPLSSSSARCSSHQALALRAVGCPRG